MKLHRILIWILQGILLLVVGFFGLIALDYYFMLDWLTDMDAFLILTLVLLCHFLAGLIRLKKSLHDKGHYEIDNNESNQRKATKEYPKDYKRGDERYYPIREKDSLGGQNLNQQLLLCL